MGERVSLPRLDERVPVASHIAVAQIVDVEDRGYPDLPTWSTSGLSAEVG